MLEKPQGYDAHRPEDDRDLFIEDLEHTHRFQTTLANDLFSEVTQGTGDLSPYAENALKIWKHMSDNGVSVDVAGVQLGLDFEDPTHQVYMRVANDLDYYYNEWEG